MCPPCCWTWTTTPLTNGAINENQLIFDEVKAYKNMPSFWATLMQYLRDVTRDV